MLKKFLTLIAGGAAVLTIAACSENLDAGSSCPLLCPAQAATLRDTTIEAVVFDSTVVGLPPIGSENFLMLAAHGDTLDTRAIVRFDTLPQSYTAANSTDSVIVKLDSAILVMPIVKPDSAHRPKFPVTIEAYNVDSTPPDSLSLATDTVSSVLATFFRPDRLLGSRTFAPESLLDTLHLPISTDSVLSRVLAGKKLRVGFRLRANPGYHIEIGSTTNGLPVSLRMIASLDTAAQPVVVTPLSNTPKGQDFLSGPLADYSIVVKGGGTNLVPGVIGVGGVPSRRTLLRFDIPSRIVDSTTVVRAALILTQKPNRTVAIHDTLTIFPSAVLAQSSITDVRSLLQFVSAQGAFGLDTARAAPGDSGLVTLQIGSLVRTWRGNAPSISPRAIALRSQGEGGAPGEIDFFSAEAAPALRPKLRITYVPQTSSGLP